VNELSRHILAKCRRRRRRRPLRPPPSQTHANDLTYVAHHMHQPALRGRERKLAYALSRSSSVGRLPKTGGRIPRPQFLSCWPTHAFILSLEREFFFLKRENDSFFQKWVKDIFQSSRTRTQKVEKSIGGVEGKPKISTLRGYLHEPEFKETTSSASESSSSLIQELRGENVFGNHLMEISYLNLDKLV